MMPGNGCALSWSIRAEVQRRISGEMILPNDTIRAVSPTGWYVACFKKSSAVSNVWNLLVVCVHADAVPYGALDGREARRM